ncbi:MAG: glutaredoxin family protein [Gammaproteobacteria bacterium]|nr:glutaredoxin family protein [Gammaproteobacteria bacterium]
MTVPVLRLYTRHECPPCEEMKQQLRAIESEFGFKLEVHDVDGQPRMAEQYGRYVPVLLWGQTVICYHRLDIDALARALTPLQDD